MDEDICASIEDAKTLGTTIALLISEKALSSSVVIAIQASIYIVKRQNLGKGIIVTFNLVPLCIHWVSSQE